ncbi:MAG: efflux RND transporter permease subunit [Neomegalonema sp.]|nr:efflux RND transporter permease subunit [Neomegalonema sp.]
MNALINWAVSRARMVFAFVFITIAAGFVAYTTLPNEGDPQIDVPILYVSVNLPGATAADVERLMVKPLETELKGVEGLKKMTANASESHAGVVLEFNFDWDKPSALADVRDRVNRAKGKLPDSALEPQIFELSTAEIPIIIVTLSGAVPERTLLRAAKDAQRRIEALKAVVEAEMSGHREEVVEVVVDPLKLEAYGVTAEELITFVRRNNRLVAAGELEGAKGRFSISMPGKFEKPSDVYSVVIKKSADRTVTIGDIAELRRTFKDRNSYARFNGKPAIALSVKKRVGESTVETVAKVRAAMKEAQATWPAPMRDAVTLDFSFDRSEEAATMADQLEDSVLTAVFLVMMVVFATLGIRSSLLVGFAVPSSFLLTFALLAAMGQAINSMVLFGLILAVGMLVDGAIVVAEFAERRVREGARPIEAYAEAARRMAWPVISSTATTLCAFLPMLLWPGGPGKWMSLLPVTIIFVLSASLLVALIYLPVIGGAIGEGISRLVRGVRALARLPERADAGETFVEPPAGRTVFGRIARRVTRHPALCVIAIALAVGALIGAGQAYQKYGKGVEFFVDTVPERAFFHIRARGNLSIDEVDAVLRKVEKIALETDGVTSVFAVTSASGGGLGFESSPSDTVASVRVELEKWDKLLARPKPLNGDTVLKSIQDKVKPIPGVFVELAEQQAGPPGGKPVQLQLTAPSLDQLGKVVDTVLAKFKTDPQLFDLEDSRPLPGIEWRLEVDRLEAGRYGADIASIGAIVSLATRGYKLDAFTPDDSDEEIDIVARFPASERSLTTLDKLRVQTSRGLTPVSAFVKRTPAPLLGSIVRRDGRLFMTISAGVVKGVNANDKITELGTWLNTAAKENPALWLGVTAEFGGDQEEQRESQAFLMQAFAGALALMFVILLAQFNSFYESILVLSAVIMSIAGVLIGLILMQQPFSIIMTGVGVVALAGIVVNNNIVLIDTYQDYRRRMDPIEAIGRTVEDRLRPVMLTTTTTIAGLLPMMFAASIDFAELKIVTGAPSALWWVPLATAVVFGLGFSTLLTLIVTPAALALRIWVGRGMQKTFSWLAGRSTPRPPVSAAARGEAQPPKSDGLAPAE